MASAIVKHGQDQPAGIEVLDKIKLHDGNGFRSGDDTAPLSSHAANRQRSSQAGVFELAAQVITLIDETRLCETSSQRAQVEARNFFCNLMRSLRHLAITVSEQALATIE
jgi:hypothetical protein